MSSESKYPMADGQVRHAPPLSMWRQHGDTVYIAGHGCVNSQGEFPHSDFEGQYRFTMDAMAATMAEAGVTFADVISTRCYVQNPADIPAHNVMYREYFSDPFPVRTTVVNCLPPGLLFEIDCIAIKSGGESA